MAMTIQYLDKAELKELLEQKMATLLSELRRISSQSGLLLSNDVYINQKQAARYMEISTAIFNNIKGDFTEYRISPGIYGYLTSEIDEYLLKKSRWI